MILSARLGERNSLDDLARTLDTSAFHLAHLFRAEVGVSIHQYLIHLRLIRALERLSQGERDLSRLALELGFSHHSHFSEKFGRVIGYSPRVARRMLTGDAPSDAIVGGRLKRGANARE